MKNYNQFFSRSLHLPCSSAGVCVCVCGSPLPSTGTLSFYHESKCTQPLNYSIGGWVMVDLNLHTNLICRRLVIANMLRFNQFRWDHWEKKKTFLHSTGPNWINPRSIDHTARALPCLLMVRLKRMRSLTGKNMHLFCYCCCCCRCCCCCHLNSVAATCIQAKIFRNFFSRLHYFWSYIYHSRSASLSIYISTSIALTLCSLFSQQS